MKKFGMAAAVLAAVLGLSREAQATPFTVTSPVNGGSALPAGVTQVGGVVLDLIGANGTRVVSQLAASALFLGFYDAGDPVQYQGNPGIIGIQTGFTPAITSALGGGVTQAAVRVTLYDGDNASGDFDFNHNALTLNGYTMGNWSAVQAQSTNSTGTVAGSFSGGGFRDEDVDTGFFFSTNATFLANFFASLVATQQVIFRINDTDPFDNYFDFTEGLDARLIDIGQGPTVITPGGNVPEPASLLLFGLGLAAAVRRRARA